MTLRKSAEPPEQAFRMEWLNYHHLLYFWMIVREGGVSKAAEVLRLAQPTISGQLRTFEDAIGAPLFQRTGRTLTMTDTGQLVFRYADEIFGIGRELQDALKGRPTGRPLRMAIGVVDVVPKMVAFRLIEPAMNVPEALQIRIEEDHAESLLGRLATHDIDLVISDRPADPGLNVRVYNHLLGECGVAFFAGSKETAKLARDFPASLEDAPFLMPLAGTTMRRSLERWFDEKGVRPRVVAEFEDSALMKVFGQAGRGIFAAPDATAAEIATQYRVKEIGRTDQIRERFYAISAERRLKHPAVIAVSEAARRDVFGEPARS